MILENRGEEGKYNSRREQRKEGRKEGEKMELQEQNKLTNSLRRLDSFTFNDFWKMCFGRSHH